MLSLSWPNQGSFNYAHNNFARLGNLLRVTTLNTESFKEYVKTSAFVLNTDSILGGILRHLAIDPEWDLEYVVEYSRLRSYSLSTPFKLTSISSSGSVIRDGFYKEGVLERWGLIENERTYVEDELRIDSLSPLIPLYNNMTNRGYKPAALKKSKPDDRTSLALMGVDVVELAVGWWMYMRMGHESGTGIESYLTRHVYVKTQLYHNQLTVINMLYEFLINDTPLSDMLVMDDVTFATLNENRIMKELLEFTLDNISNKRMVNLSHLISFLPSIYAERYFNFVDPGKSGEMAQSCWIWEPAVLKMYAIYLSLANRMGYKAGDINTVIERVKQVLPRNQDRISDRDFKTHCKALATQVFQLNDLNYK